jgi:hypothetical protein
LYLLTIFFLAVFISTTHAVTVYVPDDFDRIQEAIDVCIDGDTVIVRDGTYTGDGNRDIDFWGKAIVVMSENGPEVTIIDCEGDSLDPHRGFYFHNGEDSRSVVQGFTIMNGYVVGSWPQNSGGGMFNYEGSSPTITNCTFIGNTATNGGGMCNQYSSPKVTNCTFIGNTAAVGGGICCIWYSSPTITGNTISGNTASDGGGMWNDASSPTVTNCIFSENTAGTNGGGMLNRDFSGPTVTNCTFSGNSAGLYGGGMYNRSNSNLTLNNCILWGDLPDEIYNGSYPTVTYSNVQGGYVGEGNIDADPLFVTFHGFDYLLNRGSPCIDAGDPAIEDGRAWPVWYNNGLRSDMGAYGGPGNVGWLH